MSIKVDAMGDQCPIPVVKTMKTMEGMSEPDTIETHVDNEVAVQNVMKLASSKGYQASSKKLEEGHFVITTIVDELAGTKNEGVETPKDSSYDVSCIPDSRNNTVIAIGSDRMGNGDDELGALLIKSFLYSITTLEQLPRTMIFYNGGARLTVEGSQSLEDLQTLEAQGVEIMTCGTCLNYYKLTEKLAVGSVSNMYDIVEKLTGADKVIRP